MHGGRRRRARRRRRRQEPLAEAVGGVGGRHAAEIASCARSEACVAPQQLRRGDAATQRGAAQRSANAARRRATQRYMLAALLCLTTLPTQTPRAAAPQIHPQVGAGPRAPLHHRPLKRAENALRRRVRARRRQTPPKFETRCGDEVYELDYALANDVVAKSVTLKADARRATALLTVKKAKRGRKWTQLVAKPEAARGLIEKDWSRWEDEEDEEDALEVTAARAKEKPSTRAASKGWWRECALGTAGRLHGDLGTALHVDSKVPPSRGKFLEHAFISRWSFIVASSIGVRGTSSLVGWSIGTWR